MKGYFKIQHGILDHHIFKDVAYTEREAWIWLIDNACFETHKLRYHSNLITIERGQVPTSFRKLKEKWKWGNGRISRFLFLLKKEEMITTKTGTGFLVVTICNYETFQDQSKKVGTDSGTHSGTVSGTHSGTNRIKGNKVNKFNTSIPVMDKPITDSCKDFGNFWFKYPEYRRKEKPSAFNEWKKAVKKTSHKEIINSLASYLNSKEVKDGFAPYPAKWLKNERWLETPLVTTQPSEKEIAIDELGKLRWNYDRYLKGLRGPLSESELKFLQGYEKKYAKNNGKITWSNLGDFKDKIKQQAIDKFKNNR